MADNAPNPPTLEEQLAAAQAELASLRAAAADAAEAAAPLASTPRAEGAVDSLVVPGVPIEVSGRSVPSDLGAYDFEGDAKCARILSWRELPAIKRLDAIPNDGGKSQAEELAHCASATFYLRSILSYTNNLVGDLASSGKDSLELSRDTLDDLLASTSALYSLLDDRTAYLEFKAEHPGPTHAATRLALGAAMERKNKAFVGSTNPTIDRVIRDIAEKRDAAMLAAAAKLEGQRLAHAAIGTGRGEGSRRLTRADPGGSGGGFAAALSASGRAGSGPRSTGSQPPHLRGGGAFDGRSSRGGRGSGSSKGGRGASASAEAPADADG